MIRVTCKKKYKEGKRYKRTGTFVAKPSRKTRTQSKRWRKRVLEQPSIGRA